MNKVDAKEKARSRELRVLAQWRENDTFRESVRRREGQPNFVFYEGPPTANGKPHIGHVLGRVIKDFIGRYQTMAGRRVVRKAGWDTHGLPVELGVEKQLGLSGKQDIERYGVAEFVEQCRSSVFEYEKQWRELTEAIGYWTDMDDPYVTLDNRYIESVWHLLADIHRKGLLYKGHRVSPYCPCCQTTLSSHEVAQGYEEVKDLSATVKFPSVDGEDTFLAWTTTPWTLPANVALAVNPRLDYARVRSGGEQYVVARDLVEGLFPDGCELVSVHKGAELVGRAYRPPFDYVSPGNGHVVVEADFVSASSGTGIVHLAPAHGEDDYRTVRRHGLDFVNVVDLAGRYTAQVADFAGRFVKDCDVDIVKALAGRGLLFAKARYEHSYPFCWRCKSPLLYYAMESWFIRTTAVKAELLENNRAIEWHPPHLRDGRFGKFLEELVDWNISRNRYWGTPLNVWTCADCGAEYAPESRAALRERAVEPLEGEPELHKPYIDAIKLRCACGGAMERTPEVIDVWFDSGSMPFAQYGHPLAADGRFEAQYPADMICEGIDQTRGWFFSLLAVSTLYNGKAPYKAVLSTGHVLDENGQKMSKSKGNVVDPWEIIEAYGSDAFRWALLADSAPWNSKRFSRQIVAEAKSKVIDTIVNSHAFYALYATIDRMEEGQDAWEAPEAPGDGATAVVWASDGERAASGYNSGQPGAESAADMSAGGVAANPLDRWIVSRLHSTLLQVRKGLDATDFLNPAKQLEAFVDELSNWYIRRSRDRFWGSGLSADKLGAYRTLRGVLLTLARMIAPYAPFLAEDMYRNLAGNDAGSVHWTDYPQANPALIDAKLEREMETARRVVELAHSVRNAAGIKTRQPLSGLTVVLPGGELEPGAYEAMIAEEINVKSVRFERSDSGLVQASLRLNLKVAGRKYGPLVGPLQQALKALSAAEAQRAVDEGGLEVAADGRTVRLPLEELLVDKAAPEGLASATGYGMTVALHTTITEALAQEGVVREMVRAIQDYRRQLDLPVEARIRLVLDVPPDVRAALERFDDLLRASVLLERVRYAAEPEMETASIDDRTVRLRVE